MKIVKWKKEESKTKSYPHKYVCRQGTTELTLLRGFRTDPCIVRFTMNGKTIVDQLFYPKEGQTIKEIKQKAYEIVENHIQHNVESWSARLTALHEL